MAPQRSTKPPPRLTTLDKLTAGDKADLAAAMAKPGKKSVARMVKLKANGKRRQKRGSATKPSASSPPAAPAFRPLPFAPKQAKAPPAKNGLYGG